MFINIILYVKSCILFYFIYIFNLLYYTIFYNNMYNWFKAFKGVNKIYHFYTRGILTIDIFLILYVSCFFNIMFFYIFNIIYIYKIIKIYVLKQFIFNFKRLGIYYFLINVLELHYNLIMKVHLLKTKKILNNNIYKYKFLWHISVYNLFFYFIYLKFCISKLNFVLFKLYLWSFTYYIRFLIKIKNNKKYTIKYNIQKIKNKIYLKFSYIVNKIDKIFQNNNIKITFKYYYNTIKKFIINFFISKLLKFENSIFEIKELYLKYFINVIFLNRIKNKENTAIWYYKFLYLKFIISLYFWLILFTKVSFYNFFNFFKNLKYKKLKK